MEKIKAIYTLISFIVMFLVGKVFSYILAKLKVGYALCEDGKIFTPVLYLVHKETGRKIILMGVIHIAKKTYYEKLQSIINLFPSHAVLYEGIGKITEEEIKQFSDEELGIYNNIQNLSKDRALLSTILKLQGQRDGLEYAPEWIRTDMTMFEFVKKFAAHNVGSFFNSKHPFPAKEKELETAQLAWLFDLMMTNITGMSFVSNFFQIFSTKKSKAKKIIIVERNQIALEGIFNQAQHTDVISIWGAGHLSGMIKSLKKVGYKQEKMDWFIAYNKQKSAFKRFLVIFRRELEEKQVEKT
jgi:pheromone shutdown protein TraB